MHLNLKNHFIYNQKTLDKPLHSNHPVNKDHEELGVSTIIQDFDFPEDDNIFEQMLSEHLLGSCEEKALQEESTKMCAIL